MNSARSESHMLTYQPEHEMRHVPCHRNDIMISSCRSVLAVQLRQASLIYHKEAIVDLYTPTKG